MMWKYIGLLILVRMATSQYGPPVQSKTRHRTTTTTEASEAANEVLPPSPYQPPPGYQIPESELPDQPSQPPQQPSQPPEPSPQQPEEPSPYDTQSPPKSSYQPPNPQKPPQPPQPPYQPPQYPPNPQEPPQPPQPPYQPPQYPPNPQKPPQPPQPPYQPPQYPPNPQKPPQPPYQPPQYPPNPQKSPQLPYEPPQSPPDQPPQSPYQPPKPPQPPYEPPQSPPDQPPQSPYQPQKPPQTPYEPPQSPYQPQIPYQPPQSPPGQPQQPSQSPYQPQIPPQPPYQPPQSPYEPKKPPQSPYQPQKPPQPPYQPPQSPYQPQKPPQPPYQPPQSPSSLPQQPPQSPYEPQKPSQPPYKPPQSTSNQPQQPQLPPQTFFKPPLPSFTKPQLPPQYQPNQPYKPQKPPKTQFWWMDDANNPFKQVTKPQNQPLPGVPQSSGVPGYGPPPKPGFPPQPQQAISVQPQPSFPQPSQPFTGPKPSESHTGPITRPIPANSISPPPSINPDNPFFASALQNPIRNSESAQSCTDQDYFCVPSSSCANGLISGPLAIFKKGPCSAPGEVCCKKPGQGAPQQQPQTPYNYGTEAPIQKYTGPLNTTPHPGCAAALKCVEEFYCTAEGVMSDTPVALTRDQIEHKVPLADCQDMNTGKIGKCCRDPNYKDPWPAGMMMDAGSHDDGQYHPDDGSTEVPYNPHTIKKPLGVFNQEVTPFPVGPRPGQVPAEVFPNVNPASLTPQQQYQPQQPGQPQYQPQQPSQQPEQPQYQPQPQQPSQPKPQQPGQPQFQPQQPGQPPRPAQPQYQPQQPSQEPEQQQYQPQPQQPSQPKPQQPGQSQYQPSQQPQYQPQPQQPKPQQPEQPQFQPQQPGQPPQSQPQQPGQPQYQPQVKPQQPGPQPKQPDQPEESQELPKVPDSQRQDIEDEPSSQPPGNPATECGVRNPGTSTEPDETSFGEFPWHAEVVSTNGTILCSAAIIAPNAVLTGAHCIEGLEPEDLEIRAGGWTLGKEGPRPSQTRQVAASAIHPNYNSGSLVKDEAILVGEEPLLIGGHVAPVCLAPSGPGDYQPTGRDCWVTGWGRPALQNNAPGTVLHKIKVELIPKDECEDKLKKTHLGKYFILNQGFSCALPPKSADLCKIDVGSPLVCERSDGHYELAGVYSWDTKCSTELPGITAASDTQWIQKVLATPLEVLKQQQKKTPLFHAVIVEDIDTKPGFALGYGK